MNAPWSVRFRRLIVLGWVVFAAVAAPFALHVTHGLSAQGFDAPHSRSVWAGNQVNLLDKPAGVAPQLLQGMSRSETDTLAKHDGIALSWLHPVPGGGILLLPGPGTSPTDVAAFLSHVKQQGGQTTPVTDAQVGQALNQASEQTLKTSTALALPILALLLLLVFGTVASAVLPLMIAVVGSVLALGAVDVLESYMTLSIYLTDIVTFLALGVGVDYALFISSRFRQALAQGRTTVEAVKEAMATSGRSVLFSGIAVALALCSLFLGDTAYWHGLAVGGAIAVVSVLLVTHTLLPAMLSYFGPKIGWGKLPRVRAFGGFWPSIGLWVARLPVVMVLLGLLVLVVPGLHGPAINMKIPANLATILQRNAPLRQATKVEQQVRGPGTVSPLVIAITFPKGVSDVSTWDKVDQLTTSLVGLPDVASVSSPTALGLKPQQLAGAAAHPSAVPAQLKTALASFINPSKAPDLVVLYVTPKSGPDSQATMDLLGRVDTQVARVTPSGGHWGVGGAVPLLHDFDQLLAQRLPWIMGAVAAVAFVVLFIATGALWQALLGVVMDALVALATAGILVLTVQQGGFGLEPQPLNTAVTPLIFVLLFGLSMDYEVILLHRIQEAMHRGLSPWKATRQGVELTGGMVTGAGLIMVVVFVVLVTSPLEILKTLGLGMTVAILLDTWIVRTFMVPATVVLLGRHAFWPFGQQRGRHAR